MFIGALLIYMIVCSFGCILHYSHGVLLSKSVCHSVFSLISEKANLNQVRQSRPLCVTSVMYGVIRRRLPLSPQWAHSLETKGISKQTMSKWCRDSALTLIRRHFDIVCVTLHRRRFDVISRLCDWWRCFLISRYTMLQLCFLPAEAFSHFFFRRKLRHTTRKGVLLRGFFDQW